MDKKLKIGLAIIIALIGTGVIYVFNHSNGPQAGAAVDCSTETCFTNLGVTQTLTVDGATTLNGALTTIGQTIVGNVDITGTLSTTGSTTIGTALNVTGATTTASDIVQTSGATTTQKILSTSATKGGCVQVNATSTNTNIRLVFGVQATSTSVGTFDGEVFWVYGTCE